MKLAAECPVALIARIGHDMRMPQIHISRGPRSVLRRTALNPALWVGVLIGFPLGALVALPILGTDLDDGVASLIGAVSGSALALVGAIWLWVLQDQRTGHELGGGIVAILIPLQAAVGGLLTDAAREHEGGLEKGEGQGRLDRLERLPEECRVAKRRLQRIEPHFGRLDFDGSIALLNVEDAIDDLLATATAEVPADANGIHQTLMMLTSSAKTIQPQLKVLRDALRGAVTHFA